MVRKKSFNTSFLKLFTSLDAYAIEVLHSFVFPMFGDFLWLFCGIYIHMQCKIYTIQ